MVAEDAETALKHIDAQGALAGGLLSTMQDELQLYPATALFVLGADKEVHIFICRPCAAPRSPGEALKEAAGLMSQVAAAIRTVRTPITTAIWIDNPLEPVLITSP